MTAALLTSQAARSEELEIFRASEAGEEAWVWSDARMKEKMGVFTVTEHNKEGMFGDVFTADRLPYFPEGLLTIEVDQLPMSSTYGIQLIGFSGAEHIDTADLASDEADTGRNGFLLQGHPMAPAVESVAIKLWVGGCEGASMKMNDLVYTINLPEDRVLYRETFREEETFQPEGVLTTADKHGMLLRLKPGNAQGALLHTPMFDLADVATAAISLHDVVDGTVTVQAVLFDADGSYVGSEDVLERIGTGTHTARVADRPWPEGAEQFSLKFWLGGKPSTHATIERVLMLRGGR